MNITKSAMKGGHGRGSSSLATRQVLRGSTEIVRRMHLFHDGCHALLSDVFCLLLYFLCFRSITETVVLFLNFFVSQEILRYYTRNVFEVVKNVHTGIIYLRTAHQ